MKIAIITDVYYPFVKGGVEKRISEIAKRLADRGHDIHIYSMKWWDGEKDFIVRDNLTLHGVCKPCELYSKDGRRNIGESIHFSLNLVFPLFREKFDVVDCSQFPFFPLFVAKPYCLVKRIPLVATWHEVWGLKYWRDYLGFFKGTIAAGIEKIATYLPNRFVLVSDHTKEKLLIAGVSEDKMSVIHNGIDFDVIENIKASENSFDILYAGRLLKHKNVDVLINAISIVKKTIPDVRVGIIGKGVEKLKLKALVSKVGVSKNVHFLGFVDDVYSYMKSSKIFVLPSTREGFGMVVAESHGCGTPAIVIEHPHNASAKLVVHDENGYVVKLKSEDIAERLLHLLENKDVLARMGKNAKESAKKYCWNDITKRTEDVYDVVVK